MTAHVKFCKCLIVYNNWQGSLNNANCVSGPVTMGIPFRIMTNGASRANTLLLLPLTFIVKLCSVLFKAF